MLENEPAINGSNAPTPGLIELNEEQRKSFREIFYAAVSLAIMAWHILGPTRTKKNRRAAFWICFPARS